MKKLAKWLLYGCGALCIALGLFYFAEIVIQNKHSDSGNSTDTAIPKEEKPAAAEMVICNNSGASVSLLRDELRDIAQTGHRDLRKNLWANGCEHNPASSDSVAKVVEFIGLGDTEEQRKIHPYAFEVRLSDGSTGWVTVLDLPQRQWPSGSNWEKGKGIVGLLGIAATTVYEANIWLKKNGAGDPATDYPILFKSTNGNLTREQVTQWGQDALNTIYKKSGLYE